MLSGETASGACMPAPELQENCRLPRAPERGRSTPYQATRQLPASLAQLRDGCYRSPPLATTTDNTHTPQGNRTRAMTRNGKKRSNAALTAAALIGLATAA